MPEKKAAHKRSNGFLVCDTCRRAVPYQGYDDPGMDTWPQHRCGIEIRPFEQFLLEDPYRLPLNEEAS